MKEQDHRLFECPECLKQMKMPVSYRIAVCGCRREARAIGSLINWTTPLAPEFTRSLDDSVIMREIPPGTPPFTREHPYRLVIEPWTPGQ